MSSAATIKLFLPLGDPRRLRTAEISNWSGKAVGAPRSDLDHLLMRPEMAKPGVYMLFGADPETGGPMAYVGEAEVVGDRLKQHKAKDFWNTVVAFVSKDENLTKAHIRYLEGRIISTAQGIGRYKLYNTMASGAHLPESDAHDMESFLEKIVQLLPVLGSELLTPIAPKSAETPPAEIFYCASKGAQAKGVRSPSGFAVFSGSTAVAKVRESAKTHGAWILALRAALLQDGRLTPDGDFLRFTKEVEFSSPSAAAAVICGGNAAGPIAWRNAAGLTLKDYEAETGG